MGLDSIGGLTTEVEVRAFLADYFFGKVKVNVDEEDVDFLTVSPQRTLKELGLDDLDESELSILLDEFGVEIESLPLSMTLGKFIEGVIHGTIDSEVSSGKSLERTEKNVRNVLDSDFGDIINFNGLSDSRRFQEVGITELDIRAMLEVLKEEFDITPFSRSLRKDVTVREFIDGIVQGGKRFQNLAEIPGMGERVIDMTIQSTGSKIKAVLVASLRFSFGKEPEVSTATTLN